MKKFILFHGMSLASMAGFSQHDAKARAVINKMA